MLLVFGLSFILVLILLLVGIAAYRWGLPFARRAYYTWQRDRQQQAYALTPEGRMTHEINRLTAQCQHAAAEARSLRREADDYERRLAQVADPQVATHARRAIDNRRRSAAVYESLVQAIRHRIERVRTLAVEYRLMRDIAESNARRPDAMDSVQQFDEAAFESRLFQQYDFPSIIGELMYDVAQNDPTHAEAAMRRLREILQERDEKPSLLETPDDEALRDLQQLKRDIESLRQQLVRVDRREEDVN